MRLKTDLTGNSFLEAAPIPAPNPLLALVIDDRYVRPTDYDSLS
jgi:hypothetical protein